MQRLPSNRDAFYELPEYLDLLNRLAANVRALREAKGWTQDEAAHQCLKMGVLVYASIERAENNLTAVTLARLAIGFGVDVRSLLDPAPPPAPRKPGRPSKMTTATEAAATAAHSKLKPKRVTRAK
jgi:transcriptional regulator with XRE-family HTH domain